MEVSVPVLVVVRDPDGVGLEVLLLEEEEVLVEDVVDVPDLEDVALDDIDFVESIVTDLMEDDVMEELIRELLEDEELDVGLLVERMLTDDVLDAVEERDEVELRDENGVIDDELLGLLLAELVDEDELETVALEERLEVGDAEEDLESPVDFDEDELDDGDLESLVVPVPVRDVLTVRDTEIELVDVRVLNEDHVQ